MDVKKAIEERKSIRAYQDKMVSQEDINEIIGAARLAPTACNSQPQRFKIIAKKEDKQILRMNKIFKQDFVYNAPVILICIADVNQASKFYKNIATQPLVQWATRDATIASSFAVLRAHELGLGTCFIGLFDKEKINEVLNLPRHYEVVFAITIGYPAEEGGERSREPVERFFV